MASVIVNPRSIRPFRSSAAFESWLKTHHASEAELFLRIYKKGSSTPSISYSEAVDVALCWGWIDGVRKSYDEDSFLQRFTPRGAKSRWSAINRTRVAQLVKGGRMTPHGLREIDAAKADGRWAAAYASASQSQVPADLEAAIAADEKALVTYRGLSKQNLYALAYRTHHIKTPEGRAKRIQSFVAMLARGETPHPNSRAKKTVKQPNSAVRNPPSGRTAKRR